MSYETGGYSTVYDYGNGLLSQTTEAESGTNNLKSDLASKLGTVYFHQTKLGGNSYTTDEQGDIIHVSSYDPWGNILSSGTGINQTGLDEVEDYTGHNYDKVMDKYFVQYRMYDASSKRFITQDTNEYINIYDPVSINKYVYANNNPTNYVDYNGHEATTPENEFGDSLETRMYMDDTIVSDKTLESRAEFAFAMNSIYLNLEMIGLLAMMVPGAGSLIMASIFMPIILWNSLDNLSYMMQANQMRMDYAAGNYESDGGNHALRESFGDTTYEVITMVVRTVEITAVSTAVVQQTAKVVSGTLANKLIRSGSVVDDALSASFLSKVDDVNVKGNASVENLNPNDIRFSQRSVNGSAELIDSMKVNGWKGDPIDVVKMSDGKLTTLDNTRVVAARKTNTKVKANVHSYDELLNNDGLIARFTTPKGVPKT